MCRLQQSECKGLSSYDSWTLERRLSVLWSIGLIALQHVESSGTRDQTHVSCIGRRIPIHRTTRDVLFFFFFKCIYLLAISRVVWCALHFTSQIPQCIHFTPTVTRFDLVSSTLND